MLESRSRALLKMVRFKSLKKDKFANQVNTIAIAILEPIPFMYYIYHICCNCFEGLKKDSLKF